MIMPIVLALAVTSPDPAPLRAAVEACDRGVVADLIRSEPRRRAQWAEAVYTEQRGIAADRGGVLADASSPSGAATLASARQGIEARQQRLDDARAVERAWREFYDEYRADFLATCSGKKRDG